MFDFDRVMNKIETARVNQEKTEKTKQIDYRNKVHALVKRLRALTSAELPPGPLAVGVKVCRRVRPMVEAGNWSGCPPLRQAVDMYDSIGDFLPAEGPKGDLFVRLAQGPAPGFRGPLLPWFIVPGPSDQTKGIVCFLQNEHGVDLHDVTHVTITRVLERPDGKTLAFAKVGTGASLSKLGWAGFPEEQIAEVFRSFEST